MRIRIIYAVAAVLLVTAWISRAGNEADARVRSRCAAIGHELRQRAAFKHTQLARLGTADPKVARQWDVYLQHVDHMGQVLSDTFTGPQPTRGEDIGLAADLGLEALAHAGEGCTGSVRK